MSCSSDGIRPEERRRENWRKRKVEDRKVVFVHYHLAQVQVKAGKPVNGIWLAFGRISQTEEE